MLLAKVRTRTQQTMSGASASHVLVPVFAETTVQYREGLALRPQCVAFRLGIVELCDYARA